MDTPPNFYRGRFAPSPTGPLHPGTLVAAMASYLEARRNNGQWLLRIEDLDPPREISGSCDAIIHALDQLGFYWDEEIIFQSQRSHLYQQAVDYLLDAKLAYYCDCSRSQLHSQRYPGNCRNKNLRPDRPVAVRVTTNNQKICFKDATAGDYQQNINDFCGDFVIKRKDGLFAYQLAVVIDDAQQQISHVVRGMDLLDSTPRQIHLQHLLQFNTPEYSHFPLLLDKQGEKFSKSSYTGLSPSLNLTSLIKAWHHLNQHPVSETDFDNLQSFWDWAIEHWDNSKLASKT